MHRPVLVDANGSRGYESAWKEEYLMAEEDGKINYGRLENCCKWKGERNIDGLGINIIIQKVGFVACGGGIENNKSSGNKSRRWERTYMALREMNSNI